MRGEIPNWNNGEAAKQAHRDLDGAQAFCAAPCQAPCHLREVGSALLHLKPHEAMESAQCLYEKGFLSYPRTDSSTYSIDFDVYKLLDRRCNFTIC